MIEDEWAFLVDSHCHLEYLVGKGKSIDNLIKNAIENDVRVVNNICAKIEEMPSIINTTKKYKNVFCSVGHHPEEVRRRKVTLDEIMSYTKHKKVVAIGESGLDYYRSPENREEQIANFEIHIEASRRSKLPLIIHSRDADDDMIDILESEMKNGEFNFVLHSYCSGRKLADVGIDLGGFISFSGILTFKDSTELRDLVEFIPFDRMLVETDSPFLTPEPLRGKTNEPAYVKYIVSQLSETSGENYGTVRSMTTKNFLCLFNKVVVPKPKKRTVMYQ
ncbi:MAG: TatD family hydrolase [Rickettsiales bacterium]|jgi:TatD DNase family protein|nr:TatD family hydrolase [Rickettsiales bacterium]